MENKSLRICVSIRKGLEETAKEIVQKYGFSPFVALCMRLFMTNAKFRRIIEKNSEALKK